VHGSGFLFARESMQLCALCVGGGVAGLRSADGDVGTFGYFRDGSSWRMYPQKRGEIASVFLYAISKYVVVRTARGTTLHDMGIIQ
jgi:hypothetical protein